MIGTRRRAPLAAVAPARDRTRWETILGACSEAVAVIDGEGTVMFASAHHGARARQPTPWSGRAS